MPKSTATQLAVIVDEQIAGMHVGVEEAVAQRVAQKGLDQGAGEKGQIEAFGLQPRPVGQRRRVDPFQRQDFLAGAVPVNTRHAEIRIGFGVLRHFRQRGGFQAEIHFDHDGTAQRIDDFDDAEPPRLGGSVLGVLGGEGESGEIGVEAPLDAGPQDFDGDGARLCRGRNRRPMHLRDRGGGDRRAETRINRADRPVERSRDHRFGFGLRERRHLIL